MFDDTNMSMGRAGREEPRISARPPDMDRAVGVQAVVALHDGTFRRASLNNTVFIIKVI